MANVLNGRGEIQLRLVRVPNRGFRLCKLECVGGAVGDHPQWVPGFGFGEGVLSQDPPAALAKVREHLDGGFLNPNRMPYELTAHTNETGDLWA